jgi:hypothetical protein
LRRGTALRLSFDQSAPHSAADLKFFQDILSSVAPQTLQRAVKPSENFYAAASLSSALDVDVGTRPLSRPGSA